MLQRNQISLFGHVTNDTIYGVVKSQTDHSLVYGCWLRADGTYACHTQNLRTCGGLRDSLCKHIIVVLGQFSHYPELHDILRDWVRKSLENRSENKKQFNTKYIFDQYIDSTGSHLEVSDFVDSTPFEQVIGDYLFYEPVIVDVIELNPNWEILDWNTQREFHQLLPGRQPPRRPRELQVRRVKVREGKVAIISVNDDVNKNRPLLELHHVIDEKIVNTSNLELKYVLCIADRKREKLEIAKNKEWKMCTTCHNWICLECFLSFQSQSDLCVGSMFGFQPHEPSF
ncbi:MAG: hypothetical protein HeimC3_34200 [Candidatus Heimdallarchaeota archaeon LC_3]|nr:MAG: hypothetical protein HeimC3_34200 [Candidatus Heimdallarchaeota archaeon LC_3]